jgi:O-antigen/teichoic acid export membrane protein
MIDIKEHALFGFLWRGGYNILHQILSFVVKIILVRLLLPSDFGLIAMAMIVFTSLDIINTLAAGEPFIRDKESDSQEAKNTLFFINFFFVGTTALVGFLAAPYVARFFSSKIPSTQSIMTLIWIIRAFSLRLLLTLASNVPLAVLWKDLKFNRLYSSNIAGSLAFFITTPLCALLGLGVWSIVIGHFVEQLMISSLYVYFSPFFPRLALNREIAVRYLRYNSNIFINSIIMIIITNGDDTIIGRMLGPVILGFYNIGQQFALLAETLVLRTANEIMFPVLSSLQNETERYNQVVYKAYRLINTIALPLIGGSVVLADDFVLLILGEKWLPILPVFYVYCLSVALKGFILLAHPVLKSLNKPQIIRNAQLIMLFVFSATIYPFTKLWGAVGVSWVLVLLSLVQLLFLAPLLARAVDGYIRTALQISSRIVPSTLLMMGTVYLFKSLLPSSILSLLFLAFSGVIIYTVPLLLWDKELKGDLREALGILKKKFKPSSSVGPEI